jgi:hypothetical protein
MVSIVTLRADADVDDILGRLQAAVDEDANIATAELGRCVRVMGRDPAGAGGSASYALILGFEDQAAFDRYSAGGPHRDFADWVRPVMAEWSAALYEPRPPVMP